MTGVAHKAEQEAGGKEIAGTGGVHQLPDRGGRNGNNAAIGDDDTALFAAGDDAEPGVGGELLQRGVEVGRLIQRMQLGLVGKNQINRALAHQLEKFIAIAVDAERIRQRQRDLAAGAMRNRRGLHKGFLGAVRIPQIAFEIDDARSFDLRRVDIGGRQVLRGAEIGVHGALAVRRHQDVGAAGGGAACGGLRLIGDAGGADVVAVEIADLVVLDLADIGGTRAEIGDADNGVGGRAAGHFRGRAHVAVDRRRARLVDQRHAALGHAVVGQKLLVGAHQHVEDRIADPEHVVFCLGHLPCPGCDIAVRGYHVRPRGIKGSAPFCCSMV